MRLSVFLPLVTIAIAAVTTTATPIHEDGAALLAASTSHPKVNGKACTMSEQCQSGFCNHSKCDAKKALNAQCYKDAGCQSGTCDKKQGKCVAAALRSLGAKCSTSAQCTSGYCGKAKCATKQANGKACYKDAGCTSGFCVRSSCSATNSTTPVSPGSGKSNFADFSSGTLGAWTASPADKVSVVADSSSPGGYVARLESSSGGNTLITRTNIPASEQQQRRRRRAVTEWYVEGVFEMRISSYKRLVTNVSDDDGSIDCYANIIVNGEQTGVQYVYNGLDNEYVQLNKWFTESNGILTNTDQLTSISIGPYCHENAMMTMDIRNVTKHVEAVGGSSRK